MENFTFCAAWYNIFLEKASKINYLKNKFWYKIKMLYYSRIDISEVIGVNKTTKLKECKICNYLHFLGKEFKFQPDFWDGYNDSLMICTNLRHIAILNIEGADYCCIITGIMKPEAINVCKISIWLKKK